LLPLKINTCCYQFWCKGTQNAANISKKKTKGNLMFKETSKALLFGVTLLAMCKAFCIFPYNLNKYKKGSM